jgi:hypothetical protein
MEPPMRADMDKVLVEEPRRGRAYARAVAGARRQVRQSIDRDGESAPARLGMKGDAHVCKEFGEHLGPLYRYLRRQVNRPWAQVHSELCAVLDRRSVVQAHLFQHINGKVATQTFWRDGQVLVQQRGREVPLAESWDELYVHPRTGLLLPNRARVQRARQQNQARLQQAAAKERDRLAGSHLQPGQHWHCVDGIWYEFSLQALSAGAHAADTLVYDVLLRRMVSPANHQLLAQLYGSGLVYAAQKRQLDGRTLRRHGLASPRPAR